jgi:Ca-activated chloride channel family protein
MNKMDYIAKEEKEQKAKLEQGHLATCVKFDFFNFDKNKDHDSYMLVTMTAPEMKSTIERKPLNVSACLDISGSMSGDKLEHVKKSMRKMVQHLTEKDILGIVTFSDLIEEVLKPVKMTTENKEKAYKVIKDIATQGMTNLSGGLFKSIEQVKQTLNKDVLSRVMLFTDGQANVGVTDINQLSPLMIEQLGTITSSFFGFGTDYNEEMLTRLSKDGKGNLHHLITSEEIPTAFAKELGGLLTVFAQNIEVSLKLGKDVEMTENYNSEFKTDKNDKKNLILQVNDIYSQETRNLLFKLKISKDANEDNIAKINVAYIDLIKNKKVENDKTAMIKFVNKDKADDDKDIDKEVAMQISIFEAAKAQEQATMFAKQGNFKAAQGAINVGMAAVRGMAAFADNADISADLGDAAEYYTDSGTYGANVNLANAARMSYSTGRSVDNKSKYSKGKMKSANVVTASLMADFNEKDKEENA